MREGKGGDDVESWVLKERLARRVCSSGVQESERPAQVVVKFVKEGREDGSVTVPVSRDGHGALSCVSGKGVRGKVVVK